MFWNMFCYKTDTRYFVREITNEDIILQDIRRKSSKNPRRKKKNLDNIFKLLNLNKLLKGISNHSWNLNLEMSSSFCHDMLFFKIEDNFQHSSSIYISDIHWYLKIPKLSSSVSVSITIFNLFLHNFVMLLLQTK